MAYALSFKSNKQFTSNVTFLWKRLMHRKIDKLLSDATQMIKYKKEHKIAEKVDNIWFHFVQFEMGLSLIYAFEFVIEEILFKTFEKLLSELLNISFDSWL